MHGAARHACSLKAQERNSNSFLRQIKEPYDHTQHWDIIKRLSQLGTGTAGMRRQCIKVKYYLGKAESQKQGCLKYQNQAC